MERQMAYNNIISRTDVSPFIPEPTVNLMLESLEAQSAAMALFSRVQLPSSSLSFPVLSALPTAYFVNGDTGLKQTTEMAWTNKTMTVEELAVIVPVPENVLDDANFDIWGAVQPAVETEIGRVLDAAIFFGVNKPASWPTDITAAAVAAGNVVERGTATAQLGGIAGDLDALIGLVEMDGFDVTSLVALRTLRGQLRAARDTSGQRLLEVNGNVDAYDGININYPMRGLWPTGTDAAEVFAGDWTKQVLGIRKDMTWKFLDQAVIQDNTGAIIYNLAQQDMVAMRVTFRVAWQTANTMRYENLTENTRYPAAVMRSPGA
jgi:HK97 family phage major capsid protein